MSLEIEWQFDVADVPRVRSLLNAGRLAEWSLVAEAHTELLDTYVDTPSQAVARSGHALRLRVREGQCEATLKSLRHAATGPSARHEVSESLGEIDLAAAMTRLQSRQVLRHDLPQVPEDDPLSPLFTLRTQRDVWRVLAGGETLAEVALDECVVLDAATHADQTSLYRLEVELSGAPAERVQPFVAALCAAGELAPARVSKFEFGLRARSLPLPPRRQRMSATAADLALPAQAFGRRWLADELHEWMATVPGVRLDDAEALHQLRVGGRRLDAALRLLDAAAVRGSADLRRRMRTLMRRTARLRELALRLHELQALEAGAPLVAGAGWRRLQFQLVRERERRLQALRHQLDHPRTLRLVKLLEAHAQSRRRQVGANLAAVLSLMLRQRRRRLIRAAHRALRSQAPADCHRLRLQVKKLRYLMEPFATAHGTPMKKYVRRLEKMQTHLGELNDAHQSLAWLQSLAAHPRRLTRAAAFELGVAVERRRQTIAQQLGRLPKACARLEGRRWRKVRERLHDAPASPDEPQADDDK